MAGTTAGGRRAHDEGQGFENNFQSGCLAQNLSPTRVPNGCKQVSAFKIIRVKSPFDWLVTGDLPHEVLACDTKTIASIKTLTPSFIPEKRVHQVNALRLIHSPGLNKKAGFILWVREGDQVYFIDALKLTELYYAKKKIDLAQECVKLGGVGNFDLRLIWRDVCPTT